MRVISSMEITPATVSSEAKNLASMFAGEIKIPKNKLFLGAVYYHVKVGG